MRFIASIIIFSLIQQGWWKEDLQENKTFVATKEWQEIPDGQRIPAGLHIRMNLQTGNIEAKLLEETQESDKSEKQSTSLKQIVEKDMNDSGFLEKVAEIAVLVKNSPESEKDAISKLKKNLKQVGVNFDREEKLSDMERESKSYKELKKNYKRTHKKVFVSDSMIILQSIEEFHNITISSDIKDPETRIKTQLKLLQSFNFLMSEISNAIRFVDQGGLDQVLLPMLVNQTHIGLKTEALRVLGAICQNSLNAQIQVYERNVGSHLTQILMTSTKTVELSAALYAFSCLLRNLPRAQKKILSTSGTQALVSILAKEGELKIKAKAATIISDILVEKDLVLSKSSATDDTSAASQYAEISFPEMLLANSYCETMDSLIIANLYPFLEVADILEYFVISLENTRSLCSYLWSQSPQLRHILLTLKHRYSQSQDEYRLEVSQLLVNLIEKLYPDPIEHDEF